MQSRLALVFSTFAAFVFGASPAQSGEELSLQGPLGSEPQYAFPPAPLDGSWVVLDELMTVGSFYAPVYSYTIASAMQIDVTDLFVVSDRNEVYIDGVLLGMTPLMPDWQALVPFVGPFDNPPYTTDPDVAWSRPEFSKSSFTLPAGTHLLSFRNTHIPLDESGAPFSDGTMAFRIVPEPTSAMLLLAGGAAWLMRRRAPRVTRVRRAAPGGSVAALALVGLAGGIASVGVARAGTPCGPIQADVTSGELVIQGTAGADSLRVAIHPSNPSAVEVFVPASAATPSCAFDSTSTPFSTIRVLAGDGDDLVVFDDANGAVSSSWALIVDGGDGSDVVLGGIDLNAIPLSSAMAMIASLQQAQTMIDRALDLLDASNGSCKSVPCLVEAGATLARDVGRDLVKPTAQYVRDVESELVQPSAAAVRDAHDRIADYLQNFVAGDVHAAAQDAVTMSANVEVSVDQFELLLPMAQDLLGRAQSLYGRASTLGLSAQNGDAVTLFMNTIESHVSFIAEFADLCAEDPEPTETQSDENLQDPSGLSPFCAEVERRIEALEAITDDVENRINGIEADGDQFEMDGDALESAGLNLGDDELNSSAAFQIEAQGDALVATGDALSATADALNASWEQWAAQTESDLGSRGATMDARGYAEIDAVAGTLQAQAQSDVEAAAAALLAEADQIAADLHALMLVAAPLLRDDLSQVSAGCPVSTSNTVLGGPGNDILIGTTGSDRIEGGDGNDLIVGAGSADLLYGDDGNDLIFGGGGNDEIHGGAKVDLLIGNDGDDCIFGGGGQTLTRGSLSVDMGDVFFGIDGSDTIVSGDSETDTRAEIDLAWGGGGDDRIRLSNGGTLTVGSFSFRFGDLAFGNGGNDDIATGYGLDVIFGGAGEDTIATARGAQLTIGSGNSQFRLALGDLIFGGTSNDTIDSDDAADDPNDPNTADDIDIIFGGDGDDTIHAYAGGALSIGDPNDPDFELLLGNLVFGGAGKDEITALDGIDVIFGGDDDDTIEAGRGDQLTIGSGNNQFRLALGDLIFGGNGDDTIHGDDPADDPNDDADDDDIDVIFGGDGADKIHAYSGGMLSIGDPNDPDFELMLGNVVFGGEGDDEIDALDGIDVIFGGDDNDVISAGNGAELNIDDDFIIVLGDVLFGQAGDDKIHGDAADPPDDDALDGIDVIFGGSGADEIYGGAGGRIELPDQDFCLVFGNLMFGGTGDDTIRGDYENWDPNEPRGGIDLAFGGDGNDTIEGAGGSLIVIGDISAGQAVVIGFGNLLFGGEDNDTIRGADGATLCTGVNSDLDGLLAGLGITDLGGAADLIFCGPGNDDVDAYDGIDFVFGSSGMDDLRADNGGFIIVPISGVPTPIALGNLMFGGDDDDLITSKGRVGIPAVPPLEIDLLFGGPCDDVISAGDGMNIVFGNRADDIITTTTSTVGINLLFGNSGVDNITAADGLNVVFGNRDDDVIAAGLGINVLFGNRGNDAIGGGTGLTIAFGGRGDDVVHAGPGVAILFGNSGMDDVAGGAGLSVAFGNRGNDTVSGGNGLCVLFGNTGDDDVAGANGLCVAFGNGGHDLVSSGAGLAVLFGNSGEDRLQAGPGLSVQFGNADNDIVRAGAGGVFVAFGNRGDDVIVGAAGLNLNFGNSANDQFFGGGGVNIQFGNANEDIMRGGGSADFLFGNAGNDIISGFGAKDFLFGNRGDDTLVSDGEKDFLFGNRGNDTVRSGSDGSERDYLFGNRGNDALYGCNNADKLFGGRGSDSKDRNDCNGTSLPAPARGEVRGRVMIDVDGDGSGDIPHAGVTVMAGSSSAVTDADGLYRVAGLAAGSHTVSQSVPAGYSQVSGPAINPVSIGSMGLDLYRNEDFVNRENCFIGPGAFGCLGDACSPPAGYECRPVAVRRVTRCASTGEICAGDYECPCGDCVPSWAVVECACVNVATDCYIVFDAANEPQCSTCIGGGAVHPCNLVQDGDVYRCECPQPPPCPTDASQFTFTGVVTEVFGARPPPWNAVAIGQPWSVTYWFIRSTADQNGGDPMVGDYPAIVHYQLQVGPVNVGGAIAPNTTLIRNNAGNGLSPDRYGVQIPLPVAGPPVPFRLLLEDPSGTAWAQAGLNPLDALPLCDDIVLTRFPQRSMTVGQNLPGLWQILGSVREFGCIDCAPLPIVAPQPRTRPSKQLSAEAEQEPVLQPMPMRRLP